MPFILPPITSLAGGLNQLNEQNMLFKVEQSVIPQQKQDLLVPKKKIKP